MANSNTKSLEAPKIEDLIGKLKEIQLGFKRNLVDLQQKIETIDSKPGLLSGIEGLKKDAETRANDLENEVKQLREELKAVKELLDSNA
jgi:ribosomal protein L9